MGSNLKAQLRHEIYRAAMRGTILSVIGLRPISLWYLIIDSSSMIMSEGLLRSTTISMENIASKLLKSWQGSERVDSGNTREKGE